MAESFEHVENVEEVAGAVFQQDPKRGRGRPEGIGDTALFGNREHLLYVAAITWPEIVLNLRRVRTADDVMSALRPWEQHRSAHPTIDALLREGTRAVNTKQLRALERQGAKQLDLLQIAGERRQQCRTSFEKTSLLATQLLGRDELAENKSAVKQPAEKQASIDRLTDDQKTVIDTQWVRRAEAWDTAETEYQAAKKNYDELLNDIRESQSYISRVETVQFCASSRHALTPVNFANALAGLPYIRSRQSIKRCGKWKTDNGPAYRSIEILRRIILSFGDRTKLSSHAKEWLTSIRVSKSDKNFFALSQLGENFYYLRQAIEAVVPTKPRTSELPARIVAEYYRRHAARGSADLFFEEDDRIVIKCK